MPLGTNRIEESGLPPIHEVANPQDIGVGTPEIRRGDALRSLVTSLSGFQKEALVASRRSGKTWRMVSDEGKYLNGHDAAPPPLSFLTVGMVASYMNEITALARRQGVAIRHLRLTLDNYYTMTGSMQQRTMIGGAEPVELQVEIDCDLAGGALTEFLMNAVHASPLNGLMRGEHASLFTLSKNGVELPPRKVARLGAPMLPDPGDAGSRAVAVRETEVLLTHIGITEKKPVKAGTESAASSLTDHQNRRLNIAATAVLRDDGMKEIRQQLYSPHGKEWLFLSEEAEVDGGKGRAPDAASYISAGIGFCFMTQFGRLVPMLGLDLPRYQIIQDTHFSLGGASGGTGKAGEADPVETHVYLTTNESDEVAQEMLDLSEQTCFLHAFCRTDLKTRLKTVSIPASSTTAA
ncbi:OsmC family protein [Vannielia litorea]|uniref:OsmC-like protein n=1 Tax=Vannielia litorea TaxID=1217970 RepID=A0A1N6GUG4_9RHOB|nr:OsmC family protein [Vannielia litorea]SIO11156.1 OsmC-like protein [Vannielia litorea]